MQLQSYNLPLPQKDRPYFQTVLIAGKLLLSDSQMPRLMWSLLDSAGIAAWGTYSEGRGLLPEGYEGCIRRDSRREAGSRHP